MFYTVKTNKSHITRPSEFSSLPGLILNINSLNPDSAETPTFIFALLVSTPKFTFIYENARPKKTKIFCGSTKDILYRQPMWFFFRLVFYRVMITVISSTAHIQKKSTYCWYKPAAVLGWEQSALIFHLWAEQLTLSEWIPSTDTYR